MRPARTCIGDYTLGVLSSVPRRWKLSLFTIPANLKKLDLSIQYAQFLANMLFLDHVQNIFSGDFE